MSKEKGSSWVKQTVVGALLLTLLAGTAYLVWRWFQSPMTHVTFGRSGSTLTVSDSTNSVTYTYSADQRAESGRLLGNKIKEFATGFVPQPGCWIAQEGGRGVPDHLFLVFEHEGTINVDSTCMDPLFVSQPTPTSLMVKCANLAVNLPVTFPAGGDAWATRLRVLLELADDQVRGQTASIRDLTTLQLTGGSNRLEYVHHFPGHGPPDASACTKLPKGPCCP